MRGLVAAALACVALAASAAVTPPAADAWQPVRFLLGRWKGTVQGDAGNGTVIRTCEFVLANRFVEVRDVANYPSRTGKADVREQRAFFGVGGGRDALTLRQFHPEGWAITYTFNAAESSGTVLVFDSESVDGLERGARARETWEIYSSDEFVATFEIATTGKPLDLRSRTRFTRVGRATGD
jgi:hypothetical protein